MCDTLKIAINLRCFCYQNKLSLTTCILQCSKNSKNKGEHELWRWVNETLVNQRKTWIYPKTDKIICEKVSRNQTRWKRNEFSTDHEEFNVFTVFFYVHVPRRIVGANPGSHLVVEGRKHGGLLPKTAKFGPTERDGKYCKVTYIIWAFYLSTCKRFYILLWRVTFLGHRISKYGPGCIGDRLRQCFAVKTSERPNYYDAQWCYFASVTAIMDRRWNLRRGPHTPVVVFISPRALYRPHTSAHYITLHDHNIYHEMPRYRLARSSKRRGRHVR